MNSIQVGTRANFPRLGLALGLALAALLVGGCGGGSEEGDVSREEFIAEADAVCAQYATASATLEQDFNQSLRSGDLESAAQDFEDQASEIAAMLDQLEGLTPPVADQTTFDRIIAVGRQRVEVARDAADAIASGDKETMISAGKRGSTLAGQYYQEADSFGFEACGSGGGSGGQGAAGATGATGTT